LPAAARFAACRLYRGCGTSFADYLHRIAEHLIPPALRVPLPPAQRLPSCRYCLPPFASRFCLPSPAVRRSGYAVPAPARFCCRTARLPPGRCRACCQMGAWNTAVSFCLPFYVFAIFFPLPAACHLRSTCVLVAYLWFWIFWVHLCAWICLYLHYRFWMRLIFLLPACLDATPAVCAPFHLPAFRFCLPRALPHHACGFCHPAVTRSACTACLRSAQITVSATCCYCHRCYCV